MTLVFVHGRLSTAAALFVFAMALWALWLAVRGRGVDSSYTGAVLIGEGLLLAQGALGALLVAGSSSAAGRGMHILYGVMALLIWPFVLTFTRGGRRGEAVMFAVGSLFLWGLVLRAIDTSGLL
ncbi:MAG: hypothetical protein ACK2T6_03625 [Anaerolineae bacterium]